MNDIRFKEVSFLIAYLIAGYLLAAILRYFLFYQFDFNPSAPDQLVWTRVFLSGPGLILIGLVFFFSPLKYAFHKLFGTALFIIGLAWSFVIINELLAI